MTGGPAAGPASAYPTFSTPASICFSVANDVLVPGLILGSSAGFALPDCALAEPLKANWAAAMVMAAVPKKRRRSRLMSSDILRSLWFEGWVGNRQHYPFCDGRSDLNAARSSAQKSCGCSHAAK